MKGTASNRAICKNQCRMSAFVNCRKINEDKGEGNQYDGKIIIYF